MRWFYWIAGAYMAAYLVKANRIELEHYSPADFGAWWPFMSPELVILLDDLSTAIGAKLERSPAEGTLGRLYGSTSSQHHAGTLVVRAADVLIPPGHSLRAVYDVARGFRTVNPAGETIGFHGIGVYPDWRPRPGLHLDVRPDRNPSNPAEWAGLKVDGEQVYRGVDQAWT
jgi:hypothetical protein